MQHTLVFVEPAARIVVAALFNSLWESAVLALAVAGLLRLLPNLNATTRYAAWCVALCGSVLLPIATAIPQVRVETPHASSAVLTSTAANRATIARVRHRAIAPVTAARSATVQTSSAPSLLRVPARLRLSLPEFVAFGVFGVWLFAAVVLLIRLGFNLWKLEHLKRDALPLPVDYRERLSHWTAAEKGEREVRLCTCESIEVPVAVGLFDSMILLPQRLLETLAPDEIDQIMLHELGHLRRADDWTNGVQRVIQALFFFNPAVVYIASQLDLEREVACDDWVLYQTKNVRPYASCLTKMAEVTTWPHRALAAPGVFVTRRGLSVRVERLLRAGRNIRTSLSLGPAGAIVAALIVLFFVLQSVAPTFAFTLQVPETLPQPLSVASIPPVPHMPAKTKLKTVIIKQWAPQPRETTFVIPGVHVHVPAQTIHVPAVNVDVKEQHIKMVVPAAPAVPHVAYGFGPEFGKQISDQVNAALENANIARFHDGARNGSLDCVGCDFSGQNLAGHAFRGQKLSGADFSRANLQGADFSNSALLGVDFSRANLRNANFSHAVLTGCDLSRADLTGANFDGASMTGCDVDAGNLSPTQARALLFACRGGCDFSGADLRNQDLRGVHVSGADLSDADLRGADLSNSVLSGVNLSDAKLDGARLTNAQITGCNLEGVNLDHVDLSGAKLSGDRLTPAQ